MSRSPLAARRGVFATPCRMCYVCLDEIIMQGCDVHRRRTLRNCTYNYIHAICDVLQDERQEARLQRLWRTGTHGTPTSFTRYARRVRKFCTRSIAAIARGS